MIKFKDEKKEIFMEKLIEAMPALRAVLKLTQSELGDLLDVSRITIVGIETKRQRLAWAMTLAIISVFSLDEKTKALLGPLGLDLKECIEEEM